MTTYNVGYFVGSLAKGSINRKLAGVGAPCPEGAAVDRDSDQGSPRCTATTTMPTFQQSPEPSKMLLQPSMRFSSSA